MNLDDKIVHYALSKNLIKNTKYFLGLKYYSFFDSILHKTGIFHGWGRKKSGRKALELAKKYKTSFILMEDGFIRSIGLGVNNSPSFSIVEDDVGIYYDAYASSRLENLLNTYDFKSDEKLMIMADKAIGLIKKHFISKYNDAPIADQVFCKKYGLHSENNVLIIAQTEGDASLEYGMLEDVTTDDMIMSALQENPNAKIYLKVHPDVMSGKKASDINIDTVKDKCIIIDDNVNPISLLKYFSKVYTKTSGMGMEALICGCQCVCFGMPFYAGWGVTDDRTVCDRRKRQLSVEEVFAGAYMLYTRYYNPYRERSSDIFDTIDEIVIQRKKLYVREKYDFLALGDSHIRVFEHRLLKFLLPKKAFDLVYVPGATALGINNINSHTGAYKKFIVALEKHNYKKIITTLGEVDTAYTIWMRGQKTDLSLENLMDKAVEKYQKFLKELLNYAPVIVLSASLPTLKDDIECDDSISGVRQSIDVSQYERTQLTLAFNKRIKEFVNTQKDMIYIDMDSIALSSDGTVKKWLINPKNPCDHHYWRIPYALLLSWKLKNVI